MELVLDTDMIREWVAEAGDVAMRYFGRVAVERKADNSPVTAADRAVEKLISGYIRQHYPRHGIIGEEFGGSEAEREVTWVIDPIDGTQAFVDGLPTWSITLAVLINRVPEFGLTYLPAVGDWTYTEGEQVICNGANITGNLPTSLSGNATIFVRGDAWRWYDTDVPRLMTLGSSASHTAYTARGAAVATITHGAYLWDIAAGLAFMRKQGGDTRFLDGSPVDLQGIDLHAPIDGIMAFGHRLILNQVMERVTMRQQPVAAGR